MEVNGFRDLYLKAKAGETLARVQLLELVEERLAHKSSWLLSGVDVRWSDVRQEVYHPLLKNLDHSRNTGPIRHFWGWLRDHLYRRRLPVVGEHRRHTLSLPAMSLV